MIAERLELNVDVAALERHYVDLVKPLAPVWQGYRHGHAYGGWSVLSATGDYRDGWQMGHVAFSATGVNATRLARILGTPETSHTRPTSICTGYLADVVDQIIELGFEPHRVRLAILRPGHSTSRHRDGPDGAYIVRLHVPIITTPDCLFITDEGSMHLPADGAGYLVSVARWHQAVNRGPAPRLHLFMGVRDTRGVSRHHRSPISEEHRVWES